MAKFSPPWFAVNCLAIALLFTQLPPIFGLPVFGYLAIALLLIGGIALMPRFVAGFFSMLLGQLQQYRLSAVFTLVLARLANAPNQAAIALGGILASFSLMVAMAIMVTSSRIDRWLAGTCFAG